MSIQADPNSVPNRSMIMRDLTIRLAGWGDLLAPLMCKPQT